VQVVLPANCSQPATQLVRIRELASASYWPFPGTIVALVAPARASWKWLLMKARPSVSRFAANDPQSCLDLPNMRQRLRSDNAKRIIIYNLCTVSATSASEFEKEVTTCDITLHHDRTVFDGRRSTTIGLCMAIVG